MVEWVAQKRDSGKGMHKVEEGGSRGVRQGSEVPWTLRGRSRVE